jgi:hypothetical protein
LIVTWPGAREVRRPLASTFTIAVLEDHQYTRLLVAFKGVTFARSWSVVPKNRVVFEGLDRSFIADIDTPDTWMAGRTTTLYCPYTVEPSVLDNLTTGRGAEGETAVTPVTVAVKTKQGAFAL